MKRKEKLSLMEIFDTHDTRMTENLSKTAYGIAVSFMENDNERDRLNDIVNVCLANAETEMEAYVLSIAVISILRSGGESRTMMGIIQAKFQRVHDTLKPADENCPLGFIDETRADNALALLDKAVTSGSMPVKISTVFEIADNLAQDVDITCLYLQMITINILDSENYSEEGEGEE